MTIATRTGRDLYSSSPVLRRSWVRIPLEPQNFVLGFICYCTTAKISFTSILYPQFTHMIFIIYTSHNCNCLCYFLLLQFERAVKTAVLRMVWFISEISFAKFLKFARSFFFCNLRNFPFARKFFYHYVRWNRPIWQAKSISSPLIIPIKRDLARARARDWNTACANQSASQECRFATLKNKTKTNKPCRI